MSALLKSDVKPNAIDEAYYQQLGGWAGIEKVHIVFYDMLFAHPWLKGFFEGKDKALLVSQQTDFMASILGGPKRYYGREPGPAHCHMFITEEVFDVRHQMLGDAMERVRLAPELRAPWLKRDWAMKRALVKTSVDQCVGRYKMEPIIAPPKP